MTLPDRPDLRAMGPEVLAAATNLGLVKRATRDLAEGRVPVLTADGAHYPLTPAELASAHEQFVREFGIGLIGGCCGTTPDHVRAFAAGVAGIAPRPIPAHPPAMRLSGLEPFELSQ